MRRIAFYGGSFDPVHRGHIAIAHALVDQFELDEFVFIPAFHAPHKLRARLTSAYDRYAMLCLVTQNEPTIRVSKMEIEMPERPYSVETLTRLNHEHPDDEIFFVMGADSWMEITAWREWEKVLSLSNHIIVTRPGVELGHSHVTKGIGQQMIDLRKEGEKVRKGEGKPGWAALSTSFLSSPRSAIRDARSIFITDAVNIDISATQIRRRIRENDVSWRRDVPHEVANYIEKYQIYK